MFITNETSVGLPADTVTFCGAPFSASCHTRSSYVPGGTLSIVNLPSAPVIAAASSRHDHQPRIHGCVLQLRRTLPAPPIALVIVMPGIGSATLNNVRPFSSCALVVCSTDPCSSS